MPASRSVVGHQLNAVSAYGRGDFGESPSWGPRLPCSGDSNLSRGKCRVSQPARENATAHSQPRPVTPPVYEEVALSAPACVCASWGYTKYHNLGPALTLTLTSYLPLPVWSLLPSVHSHHPFLLPIILA